ncbi:MAG: histidine kinase dimerization/phosphoacceptor domain -containing protein [Bacteroidia bacterium]
MKLKYMLCFGLFLIVQNTFQLYAAEPDSVALHQSVKNASNDSVKVLALGALARYYAPFNNEKALSNYKLALNLCENHLLKGKDEFYEKEMGALLASKGVTEYMVADYYNAINSELKAIEIFEKYDIKEKLGRCYVVIGAIYSHQSQIKKALEYQTKSLELGRELKDSIGIALALNNMGISYFNLDRNTLAIKCYRKAYKIYKSQKNLRGMGVELINLGSAHAKLKNNDSAIFYFEKTVNIRTEINDEQGLIFSYARLGQTLLEINQAEKALAYGLKSLDLAEKKEYPRGIRDANELLASAYNAIGDFKNAYDHLEAYHTAKDSMSDSKSISRVAKSESKFKFKQELLKDSLESIARQNDLKSELKIQEAQTDKQNQRVQFLIIAIVMILIASVLILIQNRKTKQQNVIIDKQKKQVEVAFNTLKKRDEEKELLLKEIHHRVKNNLQVISSLLELQAKKVSDSESEVFKEGQSRVRAMALIHEELYQNDELGEVDIKAYAAKLSRQIQSLFKGKEKVTIVIEGSEIKLDIDTAIPLGLILNELVTNSFKYGLSDNGLLNIGFHRANEGNYTVTVKDTGLGLPDSFELKKAKSLGLRLVNRLSKQLYGGTNYTFDNGSIFNVAFKDSIERKKVA